KRLLQFDDVVVEQLEVIGGFLFAADGWEQHNDLAASVASDRVRCFQVKVGLDGDDFHIVALHLLNELESVLRARRNSGAPLPIANDGGTEMFRKIWPPAMVRTLLGAGI